MASAVPTWRLADLVDYESFLAEDERKSGEVLRRRDRAIFPRISSHSSDAPRVILRHWLQERRHLAREETGGGGDAREQREVVLPGDAFAQTRALLGVTLGALGALLGGGAAWAALTYTRGGEPINALAFFCEFALLQVVILAIALLAFVCRRFVPELPSLARLLWRRARPPRARAGCGDARARELRERRARSSRQAGASCEAGAVCTGASARGISCG